MKTFLVTEEEDTEEDWLKYSYDYSTETAEKAAEQHVIDIHLETFEQGQEFIVLVKSENGSVEIFKIKACHTQFTDHEGIIENDIELDTERIG